MEHSWSERSERAALLQNGYLVVKDLLSPAEIARLRQITNALLEEDADRTPKP